MRIEIFFMGYNGHHFPMVLLKKMNIMIKMNR